jgi:hypothetical protein
MKLEEINNRTKDAINHLIEALEAGHSEVLTQYLGAMARFHTYSFGNVMLIARETRCYLRRRLPYVELARPLCQTRRKRHPHSCSYDWPQQWRCCCP